MRGLSDKAIVVAGGATGIGAATAKRLGAEGARVLIGDINVDGAEATATEIVDARGIAEVVAFDMADKDACRALVEAAVASWGRLDGLYNCAADLSHATLGRDTDVLEVPVEVWERTLRVNLTGYFLTARYAIPHLLEGGGGAIVNTTSGVVRGNRRFAAYAAAKNGVVALTRHIAERWGREGVRCNAIDPGMVLTGNSLEMVSDEERNAMRKIARSPRLGEPGDIAAMVAFLLSDDALWINGQTYVASSHAGATL
jgi:NAD(P)-dependent dehydrogenase (short-subunit alcohol dehydrogenase family)